MKNSKMIVWIVAIALCTSCTNTKETPKGFQFTVLRGGDGIMAKPGEFLMMDMVFTDGKDSVWNDTRKSDPLMRMVPDTSAIRMEEGIQEVFRMISKGDSITFKVPAKVLFEKDFHQPLPKNVSPQSEFTFNIVVKNRYTRDEAMKMRDSLLAIQKEKFAIERTAFLKQFVIDNRAKIAADDAIIDAWLRKQKINAVQDSSGIRYVVQVEGSKPKPTITESVLVIYKGNIMETGKEFDKSEKPVPMAISRLVTGWQIALTKFPVGSKVTLYIPSTLAYGEQGNQGIPGNANLIFEVELVGIK